jgi:hypothetical protein
MFELGAALASLIGKGVDLVILNSLQKYLNEGVEIEKELLAEWGRAPDLYDSKIETLLAKRKIIKQAVLDQAALLKAGKP